MDWLKNIWSFLEPIGVSLIKANNPKYADKIDLAYKAIKENNMPSIKDGVDMILAQKEKEIVEQIERVEEKIEVEPVGGVTVEVPIKHEVELDILKNANWSTFNSKYFTKKQVIDSVEDMEITSPTPRDIRCKIHRSFAEGEYGFFPVCIYKDGKVKLGGHGSKGGMAYGNFTRNTGLVGKSGSDYGIDFKEIKQWFLVRTNFEGRPKGVLGRSQIKEV